MIAHDSPQAMLAREALVFQRGLFQRFHTQLTWEDVEDITQTVLCEKAPLAPTDRPIEVQRAWLRTVLRNEAIDFLRHRDGRRQTGSVSSGRRVVSLNALPAGFDDAGDAESRTRALATEEPGYAEAEQALDREWDQLSAAAIVASALEHLAPDQRQLIELRYREGLSNREMAERVGLSVKGLEKRWARTWARFVDVVQDDVTHDARCIQVRGHLTAGSTADAVARFEAHLAGCIGCQLWQRARAATAGSSAVIAHPGFLLGLLSKVGLGGTFTRLQSIGDQVVGAVGGGGASVAGLIGVKAASSCAAAGLCALGVIVGPTVGQRAESPHRGPARHGAARQPRAPAKLTTPVTQSALLVSPQRRSASSRSGTTASVAGTPQESLGRSERSAAQQVRATGSPFTPEAADPAEDPQPTDTKLVAQAAAARTPRAARQQLPVRGSAFSSPFSP